MRLRVWGGEFQVQTWDLAHETGDLIHDKADQRSLREIFSTGIDKRPTPGEYSTKKTVKTRFWPWLLVYSP